MAYFHVIIYMLFKLIKIRQFSRYTVPPFSCESIRNRYSMRPSVL